MTAEPLDSLSDVVLAGLEHGTADSHLRERIFIEEAEQPAMLRALAEAGAEEALVLSTCDRVVLAARGAHGTDLSCEPLVEALAARAGGEADTVRAQASRYTGLGAVRHLFAIASSLESQVIGEPQVLGQVKEAHRQAAAAGLSGGLLDTVLQAAYAAAKRVRSETTIGERPVSIASAAVATAREIHGDLKRARVFLIGLAEMGELLAAQFEEAGVAELTVAHPRARRAATVATRLSATRAEWAELEERLPEHDILIAALGQGSRVLARDDLRRALKRRRYRPIFAIDAAVPGDIDPAVGELDEVFLYDLGDLEQVAQLGQATREAAGAEAWRIVDAEVQAFIERLSARAAAPSLAALRAHAEALRQEILASGNVDAEQATRLLIARLLHAPASALRAAGASQEDRRWLEESLARLFGLPLERAPQRVEEARAADREPIGREAGAAAGGGGKHEETGKP